MNDDLISRQAAIGGIEQFRPIEPKRGETSMEAVNRSAWDCAINCIETFIRTMPPSAQPEIIRCKDCKHNSHKPESGNASCTLLYGMTDQYGYCHLAERRRDEQTN